MANEEKKDFNAMLHDNKDMPKFQVITDQKSIEKYGGNNMYFAPPIDYDKVMKKIPYGNPVWEEQIQRLKSEMEEWFDRYTDPKMDARKGGAVGRGQEKNVL